ncbi:MAG: hypothetical protein P8Y42_12775 [Exilibacterium sp.]
MKNLSAVIAVVMLGAASANALAENNWYVDFALASGGDDLAEVEVEYIGGDTGDVDITAGGGFSFAAGRSFDLSENGPWEGYVSLGYKSDGVFAISGDNASFDRFPIDAMAFYRLGKFKIGGGVTYELNPELDLDDTGLGSFDFDNALGVMAQFDWVVSDSVAIGLRYTAIDYEVPPSIMK